MIPPEVATKLAKILPRLASEHDGEVINTLRALDRILTGAGLDWHALAAAVEASARTSRPLDFSAFADMAAEAEREAEELEAARNAPDAPARMWGMRLWGDGIEHWSTVAQHALMLDWTFPKAQGGRILTKEERERLKTWTRSHRLTNADAGWLSGIVERLHVVAEKVGAHRRAAA